MLPFAAFHTIIERIIHHAVRQITRQRAMLSEKDTMRGARYPRDAR